MESGSGGELDELMPQSPQTLPKKRLADARAPTFEKFLVVWNCNNVEVEDLLPGFALRHRPSP